MHLLKREVKGNYERRKKEAREKIKIRKENEKKKN